MLLSEAALEPRKVYRRTSLRARWCSPEILYRPRHRITQLTRCPQRPIRVAEHIARKQNEISLPAADNVISLRRRSDEADSSCRHSRFPPDAVCEWSLITGASRNRCLSHVSAGGTVD